MQFNSSSNGLLIPDQFLSGNSQKTKSFMGYGAMGPGYLGNYTAGAQSDGRGYVYFPDMAAKHDLRPQARRHITGKARWLVRNTGIGGRFRDGITDMVGFLTPQAATTDSDWNIEIEQLAKEVLGNPLLFDTAGKESFYDRQLTITRLALQDGDCGVALALDDDGNPTTRIYQSPQIASPYGVSYNDEWWDGVRTDENERVQEISLLTEDLSEEARTISAADFILYGNQEPGAVRGVSAFARFADRMLDVREIDNDEIRGIKAANLVGFVITNGVLQNQQNTAVMQKLLAAAAMGEGPSTGAPAEIKIEDITRGGGAVANLGLGQQMDVIHDDRRNPNRASLVDYFIRDMAWSSKYPPEVLWFLGQLNGPSVRFTIQQAERANESYRHPLQEKFCKRIWSWFCAQMQMQGRIRWCKDRNFTACNWLRKQAMIIDLGRDITSGLAEIHAGGNTWQAWYGEANQDWRQQFRQRAAELKEAAALEIEYELAPGSLLGNATVNLAPGQQQQQPQQPEAKP